MERPLAHFAGGAAALAVEHRQLGVLERGRPGQQVESLENEADLGIADVRPLVAGELGDVDLVEQITAPRRAVEAAEQIHQRGLARAAGAHQGHEFAALDFERNAPHGVDGHLAGVVDLVEILDLDDSRHERSV